MDSPMNTQRSRNAPMSPNSNYQNQTNFQHDQPLNNNFNNPDMHEYQGPAMNTGNDHSQDQYKRDLTDMLCGQVNQALVVPKTFYFFFFAAFGSLFPLMAIYFKQMAMSPMQVGVLFGLKPFVEFVAAPFWANVGAKWRQAKLIFLFSLVCWIGFTLGLGFIHPPVHSCLVHNDTHIFFSETADKLRHHTKREITSSRFDQERTKSIHKRDADDSNTFVDESNRHWRIVNVTRIIRIRKTTTTTRKLEHIINYRPPGKPKDQSDHFEDAKDEAVEEIFHLETTRKTPEKIVDTAVHTTVDNFNTGIVNKSRTSNNFLPNEMIPDIGRISLPISLNLATQKPNPEKNEIKNFFDKGDLENAKKQGKIVYLNEPDMNLIKPTLETSVVYHRNDVQRIFLIFLFFILAGEFFSAPAITLADQATMSILGPNCAELYGRQRMFGSLGWAISMFSVGLILDNARIFTDHPCGHAGPGERNYSVCFAIFAVMMGFAFVVATQFEFDYGNEEGIPLKSMANNLKKKVAKNPQFNPQILVNESEEQSDFNQPEYQEPRPTQTKVADLPENSSSRYLELLMLCKSMKYITFLFIVWFMGIGVGLVFTFLFWHLQDMGGTPTLYGIASVINHLSELMAYFFVNQVVKKYGHIKIFYAALIGNTLRFMYVAVLTEPIWILPFEFIQGITHALMWATATSYFSQSIPNELRSTAQGFLQSLHFGLGRGFGALMGGVLISTFGSKITFFVYGFCCFVICAVYMVINSKSDNLIAQQNPQYAQNQYVNHVDNLNEPIPEFNNVSNPMMNDTNYYYQSDNQGSNNQSDSNNHNSFPVMSPHGVPSSNQNWNNQFKSNRNNFA